jgi:hypothetical protein
MTFFAIKNYKYSLTAFVVVVFLISFVNQALALSAPIITYAQEINADGVRELQVRGVVAKGSDVLIYVSGKLSGQASVENENELVDDFIFKQAKNLPQFPYSIQAVSRELATSNVSFPSDQVVIKSSTVKKKFPVVVESTKKNKEIIKKLDFVDKTKTDEIDFSAKENGTISKEAVVEENVIVKGVEGAAVKKESDDKSQPDIESILNNQPTMNDQGRTGLITEQKENLGKIKINLLIFIIFLMAVISWIIWVNRELVKEKHGDENEANDSNDINQGIKFKNFSDNLLAGNIKDEKKDEKNIDILNF